MRPTLVQLWRPRGDEHALAASLCLCEPDPDLLRQLVEAAQEQVARDLPGSRVRVHRWHVWRVVRTMAKNNLVNTPSDRATAFGLLASEPGRED